MRIPNPHFEIKITQRSKGQSAVAGAAYQSGERLFSEYDQKHKDYSRKDGVAYAEIMLPSNAPPEYADRETLWNAVEAVEKQWNSQLARRFVLALPREVPEEMYPEMVREYCKQFFVSKGMIADFAIHDPRPPGHNPHCHVMLTLRAMDEKGKWLPKGRKVYDLDDNGERIRLPTGEWKSHKECTMDWNERAHGQEWRTGWEEVQNRYLEMAGSPVRVDLRSYEKQGIDVIPTVHMGSAASAMERKGIQTNLGNLNRDIRAANRMMAAIRKTIQNLRGWLSEITEAIKELPEESPQKRTSPDLVNLLQDYLNLRKAERADWSRYGQQKGTVKDLQMFANATNYLKDHEIFTLEKLDAVLAEVKQRHDGITSGMKKSESRMKTITGIQRAVSTCRQHKAVHDKYVQTGWKKAQAAYAEKHRDELDAYNRAYRFLKKQGFGMDVNLAELQMEYEQLQASHADYAWQLAAVREELKPLEEIRHCVGKVLALKEVVKKKPEPKHSLIERIQDYGEESRKKAEQQRQEKEQNIEH